MLSNLLNMPWEPNKTHMQAELSFWVSILWPEVSEHPLSFKSRGSSGLWKLLKNTPSKFHPFLSSQVLFVSHLSYCGASLVAQMVKNLPAMRETWVQFLDRKDPPEKRMATHSSILAWRIPWIEEPGGLQFMGSHRVGHDWMTYILSHTYTYFGVWHGEWNFPDQGLNYWITKEVLFKRRFQLFGHALRHVGS